MTDHGGPPACASQDMDADIDRILSLSGSLGSLGSLGLETEDLICFDDQQRRDQSISPQSVAGTATTIAASTSTNNNGFGRSSSGDRTNPMDFFPRLVVGNTVRNDLSAVDGDEEFILADIVGLRGVSEASTTSGTSLGTSDESEEEEEEEDENEHERILQLLLSTPSSSPTTTSTAYVISIGSDASRSPGSTTSVTSVTSATTSSSSTSSSTSTNTSTKTDKYYQTILADLRHQMRPIQEAADYGQAERYGMTWRDLLDIVLSRVHPLATTTNDAVDDDSTTSWATCTSSGSSTTTTTAGSKTFDVIPTRHYQPLLLECARIWRRSLAEAIARNKRSKDDGKDGASMLKKNHNKTYRNLLHPDDRHYLAQQAARIVERYLHLHQVFPGGREEVAVEDDISNTGDGDAYEVHPWDDFSESTVVASVRFLDFVYYDILRPAYDMGWKDLAYEHIEDPTYYVSDRKTKNGTANIDDEAELSVNPSVEMLRFSPYLCGPVVGAIHTIIAKAAGRDDAARFELFDQQDAGNEEEEDVADLLAMISEWKSPSPIDLGMTPRQILRFKLDSLCRIVVVGQNDDQSTLRPSIGHKKGYRLEEADRIISDCLLGWRILARHRLEDTHCHTYSAHRQIRDTVASELVDYALQIVHHFKRIHVINIRNMADYSTVRTVEETVKAMTFVYNGFLLPAHQIGIHNLSSHIKEVEGHSQTFSSLVSAGIHHLRHSALYLEEGASREAMLFDHKLRSMGIGTRAYILRVELNKLEQIKKLELVASGEADHLLRNCLASWKESLREIWDRSLVEINKPHGGDELAKAKSVLIKMADELVHQYQRLHQMNSDGIDFFLSSIGETCLILDFIYEHFLSFGLGLGFTFIPDDSLGRLLCGGVGPAPTFGKLYLPFDHQMDNGAYDFLELIVNAIQNLEDKSDAETAGYYYDKICRAGNGEYKAYLEDELPSYAIKQ